MADTLVRVDTQIVDLLNQLAQLHEQREKCLGGDDGERYSVYPIRDEEAFKIHKEQEARVWNASICKFANDVADYKLLNALEKAIMDKSLSWFAKADGLVGDNIVYRFRMSARTYEEGMFYNLQGYVETVHAESYSLALREMTEKNEAEMLRILKLSDASAALAAKTNFIKKYLFSKESEAIRTWAFVIVEGVGFTSLFTVPHWFKSRGKLKSFAFLNEEINKDETIHMRFGVMKMHKLPEGMLNVDEAYRIMDEFVQIEDAFVDELIPTPIEDLNAADVRQHVRCIADNVLAYAGYAKLYHVKSTLPFIKAVDMGTRTNFFEDRDSSYVRTTTSRDTTDHLTNPESYMF